MSQRGKDEKQATSHENESLAPSHEEAAVHAPTSAGVPETLGSFLAIPVYFGYYQLFSVYPVSLRISLLGIIVVITNLICVGGVLLLRSPLWGRYLNVVDLLVKCASLGSVFEVTYLYDKPFFFRSPFLWYSNATYLLPIAASTYIAIKYKMNFIRDVFRPWVVDGVVRFFHAVQLPTQQRPRRKLDRSFPPRDPV